MSVNEITGDIIRDGYGIICHQVNFQGVMGGGVAASIRERLLSDEQYKEYQRYCRTNGAGALGKVWYTPVDAEKAKDNKPLVVANMFCQNARPDARTGCLTHYDFMEDCFADVKNIAETWKRPIFIPGYIGCGIAGGDWNRVKWIIQHTFRDAKVPVTIVYWEKESWNQMDDDELPFN